MRCEKEQLADVVALPLALALLCRVMHKAMQLKMEGAGELQAPLLVLSVSL